MAEMISTGDAQYALELVKRICTEVGPGLPGSPEERERAAIIEKQLESHLRKENVAVEEFTFAPDAFVGSLPLSAILILFAALSNMSIGLSGISPWVTSSAGLLLSMCSLALVILEFICSLEFVDRFFPKKQSINVIGTLRKPGTKNVKRLLLMSGHHDSAMEFTWFYLVGYGLFVLSSIYFIALAAILVMSIFQVAGILIGDPGLVGFGTIGWILLIFLIAPAVIFALFFTNGSKVPGAVDNLSASALVVAMCRFLVNNPSYIPTDTEIRFISFGGEEAGLRGSRRYVTRHFAELQRLDARLLNIEMVAHPEIAILTTDINGTVKNSTEIVRSAAAAAQRAGVPYTVKPASLGMSNDAGPFSRAGLKATTLIPFKMPQQLVALFHQRRDTPDKLTIEPLLNVLKLTLEWVSCGGELKNEKTLEEVR